MTKYSSAILVESFDDYKIIKKKFEKNVHWLVPTEYLYNKLANIGEKVTNFEKDALTQKEYDNLCIHVHDFLNQCNSNIDNEINFSNPYYFESIKRSLISFFITTSYKYLIYKKIINKYNNRSCKLYIVGNLNYFKNVKLDLNFGRFDTLYIYFVKLINNENIKYIETNITPNPFNNEKIVFKLSFFEIVLNTLSNSLSSVSFKIHRKLLRNTILKNILNKISIFNSKKKIVIWGKNNRNDIIYDTFYKIIYNRGYIRYDDGLMLSLNCSISDLNKNKELHKKLNSFFKNRIDSSKLNIFFNKDDQKYLSLMLTDRICYSHQILLSHKAKINLLFNDKFKKLNQYDFVLTNGFFRVEEKLFYYFCEDNKDKKFKFVAFEHGMTYGLTSRDKYYIDSYSMKYADIGVYLNQYSYNYVKDKFLHQTKFVSGLPKKINKSFIYFMPKFIINLYLGLNLFKKKIFLLAPCENNNYVYGPFYPTDFQKEQTLKSILIDLYSDYPNSQIILKAYPGQRYIDKNDYSYLKKYFKNLIIIYDIELKLITKVINYAVLFYYSSTLGIVSSSKAKVFLYKFDFDNKIYIKNMKKIKDTKNSEKLLLNKKNLNNKWNPSFVDYLFD